MAAYLVIGIKLKYYLNAGSNLAYKMYAAGMFWG